MFPEPVISIAIEPKTKADVDKLGIGAAEARPRGPVASASTRTRRAGQTIITGMGELHLEIIVDRLKREFKVEANVGKPEVAYREAITKKADVRGQVRRQSGGHGQYGHVVMEIEPGERGAGFVFENDIVGGVIPKEFIPAIEKGVREAMGRGVLAGFPMVDMKARSTTAATTRSIRARRRSRSPRPSASRTAPSAPASASSSRSWRSRSSSRRSTWATSSAT